MVHRSVTRGGTSADPPPGRYTGSRSRARLLALSLLRARRAFTHVRMRLVRHAFASAGTNIRFDPRDTFSYQSIYAGHDVFIGSGAHVSSAHGRISIGNYVMMGPNVTVLGGNHRTDVVGTPMARVHDKIFGSDPDLSIGDEAWIGASSILLPGATIGRGAIVAAGAVVNRPVLPYTVVAGIPARRVGDRFSREQAEAHETLLYGRVREDLTHLTPNEGQ